MSGPYDGRPGGWHDDDGSEHGTPAESEAPGGSRPLPPELDPRGPASRRPAGRPGAGSSGSKPGLRGWSRRRWLAVTSGSLVTVIVVVVVVAIIGILSVLGAIHHLNVFGGDTNRPGGGAVGDLNILVVGSDSRAGLTAAQQKELHVGHDPGQRSDTMILLHIPKGGGKATLVSLPRDSYVTIPAHCPGGAAPSNNHCPHGASVVPAAMNKLNAAYSIGAAKLTIRTVEANTGVRIDHYIEINFLGFYKMVNALGGVDICTAKPINDPVHYDAATGGYVGSGLQLKAGNNHLDGTTALEYVRAREFDPGQGDLGRIKRQQQFMGALLRKAESASTLLNPIRLFDFLKQFASSLTTDSGFGTKQIKTLLLKLHSMSPSNVTMLTVPLSNTALSTPVGSAVQWDPVKSKRLFADFTNDHPITNVIGHKTKLTVAPSSIALKVLNATNTNGLASRAAGALGQVGFHVTGTGNAPKGSDPTQTVVLYGASRADSAKTVSAAVVGSTMREDDSLGTGLELLVGSSYTKVHAVHVSNSSSSTSSTTAANAACS